MVCRQYLLWSFSNSAHRHSDNGQTMPFPLSPAEFGGLAPTGSYLLLFMLLLHLYRCLYQQGQALHIRVILKENT